MRPTVHSAVLPAAVPDRATDFLGFGLFWVVSDMIGFLIIRAKAGARQARSLIFLKQFVEFVFVGVVAEV